MITVSPRAKAIDNSGIHRAIGPADRWLPNHKIKASSEPGPVRIATKPEPSERERQSTVPCVSAMRSPQPVRQLCGTSSEIHQEHALGSLDVAADSEASGYECLQWGKSSLGDLPPGFGARNDLHVRTLGSLLRNGAAFFTDCNRPRGWFL